METVTHNLGIVMSDERRPRPFVLLRDVPPAVMGKAVERTLDYKLGIDAYGLKVGTLVRHTGYICDCSFDQPDCGTSTGCWGSALAVSA